MTKKELTTKFQFTCNKLALNYENAKFYEDCIFIENANHVGIVFDEEQNIIGMGKLSVINSEDYNKMWTLEEKRKYRKKIIGLSYPFNRYAVKDIVDMANKIHIEEKNGKKICVCEDNYYDTKDNEIEYMELLTYIKFLGELVNTYHKKCYQMLNLGFDMPDVYTYLAKVIEKINESIALGKKIELGIGIDNDFFYYSLLTDIVHLLTNVEAKTLTALAIKFLARFQIDDLEHNEDTLQLEKNLRKSENKEEPIRRKL